MVDGVIHEWARGVVLGGDVRRTLETVQQFGDAATVALSCVLIVLLDPAHRRRVVTVVITALAVAACAYVLKMAIGRPRPVLGDANFLCGPLGTYPLKDALSQSGWELRSPWQFWLKGTSDLWSFPSSHTSGATGLGLALWWLYPRIKPLVIVLIVVVGAARVILNAHYLSDVLAGAAVGLIIAPLVLRRANLQRDSL
jgi:membrane-associated phospholipid phosphatase